LSSKNEKMVIYSSFSLSVIKGKIVDQAGCFENTRDFSSEEIPLGYRLRSPLLPSRNHARSALLTVFSITHPALFIFTELEILPFLSLNFHLNLTLFIVMRNTYPLTID